MTEQPDAYGKMMAALRELSPHNWGYYAGLIEAAYESEHTRADAAEAQAKLWQDAVAAVRAEADLITKAYEAAEAQRDRLTAEVQMLGQRVHDTWHKGSTFGDCEEATCGLARAIVHTAIR